MLDVPESSPVWSMSDFRATTGRPVPQPGECFVLAARRDADGRHRGCQSPLFFADVMLKDEGMAELLPATAMPVIFDEAASVAGNRQPVFRRKRVDGAGQPTLPATPSWKALARPATSTCRRPAPTSKRRPGFPPDAGAVDPPAIPCPSWRAGQFRQPARRADQPARTLRGAAETQAERSEGLEAAGNAASNCSPVSSLAGG